jgi:hypothetical protein
MQKIALPFAAACLLAIAAVGAHAQPVWKWRDANGELHISDSAPPPGTPQKSIISAPGGMVGGSAVLVPVGPGSVLTKPQSASDAARPASAPLSDLERKKIAADKEKADQQKAERAALEQKNAAIRKDNCQRATSEAANLQLGGRIARVNAQGEREILDDNQRAAELKRAQDIVAQNCGAAPAGQ